MISARRDVEVEIEIRDDHASDREVAAWVLHQGGTLSVRTPGGIQRVDASNPLPSLSEFVVTSVAFEKKSRITDEGMSRLAALKSLTSISLDGCSVTGKGIKALEELRSMERVHLANLALTDADLAVFRDWTRVTSLNLENRKSGGLTDAGISQLKGLNRIEVLNLWGHSVGDASLAVIGGMKQLQELQIGPTLKPAAPAGIKVTDSGLVHLADLTELTQLRIRGSEISDAGLKFLQAMRNLRKLDLAESRITGQGFAEIPVTVEALDLGKCPLENSHLARLIHLSRLGDLTLAATPITDEGVVHLASLKSVRRFELSRLPLSRKAVEALQKAVPKALLVTTPKMLKP